MFTPHASTVVLTFSSPRLSLLTLASPTFGPWTSPLFLLSHRSVTSTITHSYHRRLKLQHASQGSTSALGDGQRHQEEQDNPRGRTRLWNHVGHPSSGTSSWLTVTLCSFSGVAYALSTNPEQISVVSRWKGELYYQTKDKQKVPSVIAYDKSGQPAAWGYEIQYSHTPLKWLKLLLVEEDELPSHLSSSAEYKSLKKQVKALCKSPVAIIGDYLRLLWAHAWSQIKAALGETFVEACKLKIVVTLPAIWSPCAQQRMREAIQVAGIAGRAEDQHVSLDFVSEPEAAILASLKSMRNREDVEVSRGSMLSAAAC